MASRGSAQLRAIFIPATASFLGTGAAVVVTADTVADANAAAELAAGRQLAAEEAMLGMATEWSSLTSDADAAETLLRRHERGRGRGFGRGNRRRSYALGISGSGTAGEPELFAIMTYFEKLGSMLALTGAAATDARAFLREDSCRWRDLLVELRDRSLSETPALDGNRFEQLTHAVTTLRFLCDGSATAQTARLTWRPVRIIEESLSLEGDDTVLHAVIQNDNIIDSPVPAVRVALRTHDGVALGFVLVFPSDDRVPHNGEIVIRGRLPWPTEGVASGVTLVSGTRDFELAQKTQARFPGIGGSTWVDY